MKLTLVTGLTGLCCSPSSSSCCGGGSCARSTACSGSACSVIVIPLSLFPRLLDNVAELLGVASGVSLVLFLGIVFLLLVCVHLSWEVSAAGGGDPHPRRRLRPARAQHDRAPAQPEPHAARDDTWCPAMVNGKRVLIIIPALERGRLDRRRRRRGPRRAARRRRARGRRRLHRPHRGRRRGRRCDRGASCRSTSASAARCGSATATPGTTATTWRSRSTRTASTTRATCRSWSTSLDDTPTW